MTHGELKTLVGDGGRVEPNIDGDEYDYLEKALARWGDRAYKRYRNPHYVTASIARLFPRR